MKASEGKGAGKGNQVSGIIFRQMPGPHAGKMMCIFPLTPTLSLREREKTKSKNPAIGWVL